jgi:hypothetical protein
MRYIKNTLRCLFVIAFFATIVSGCKATIKKDITSFKPMPVRHHSCIAAFYNFENFYDTINNTTINYFLSWPESALDEVAQSHL